MLCGKRLVTNLLCNVAWFVAFSLAVGAVFGIGAWIVAGPGEGRWWILISTAATFNISVTWELTIERRQR